MNLFTFANFIHGYENIITGIAQIAIHTLELIAVITIVLGCIKSLYYRISKYIKKNRHNIRMDLGKSLALGLEFAMGAEIIKTITIAHDWEEIAILGVIVVLRTVLAVLIHWEMKNEEKHMLEKEARKAKELEQKVEETKNAE